MLVLIITASIPDSQAQSDDPLLEQQASSFNGSLSYNIPGDWIFDDSVATLTTLRAATEERYISSGGLPSNMSPGLVTVLRVSLDPEFSLETVLQSALGGALRIYGAFDQLADAEAEVQQTTFLGQDALMISEPISNGEEAGHLYAVATQVGNSFVEFRGVVGVDDSNGSVEDALELFMRIQETVEIDEVVLSSSTDYVFLSQEVVLFDGSLQLLMPAGVVVDDSPAENGVVFFESAEGIREMLGQGERPAAGFSGSVMIFETDSAAETVLNEELGSLGRPEPPVVNDMSNFVPGDREGIFGYTGFRRIPAQDISDFWHESYAYGEDGYILLLRFNLFDDNRFQNPRFRQIIGDAVLDTEGLATFFEKVD